MEWVASFYATQDKLSGVYTGASAPQPLDLARVDQIVARLGHPSGAVLELGAGGGLTALAAAQRGYRVIAIELVPTSAAHARSLAAGATPGSLTVLEGSFYTIDLDDQFDVVCYWDGFGIGDDDDQRTLLSRIHSWLKPSGVALIDINTPWYWAHAAGQRMTTATFVREYAFEADGCRMLDVWWQPGHDDQRVTQSLRCYSPQDLRLLLKGTGLRLDAIVPGGSVDYEANTYTPHVPLEQAMQYCAHLRRDHPA